MSARRSTYRQEPVRKRQQPYSSSREVESQRMPPLYDLDAAIRGRLPDVDHDTALLHLTAMRLGRIIEGLLHQTLRPEGLDRSQHSVLTALWLVGPPHQLSPTQLSRAVVQTTSGMTKTLRRLERAGLLDRVPDPTDGRGQLVSLTKHGHRLVEHHVRELIARWDERLERYDAEQRSRLATAMWLLLVAMEPTFDLPET